MHNNKKIKKSRILFKTSVILVFIVSIFGITLYLYIETQSRLDIGSGISESMDKVSIEIAGHHFLIPKAYIWSRASWRGGKMTGVNMHALLPDFKPYSKEVKAEFDKSGHGNVISILLTERGALMSAEENLLRMKNDAITKESKDSLGFMFLRLPDRYPKEELFIRRLMMGLFTSLCVMHLVV